MIIKDEEKYIKQCLDNALPLVDEAIIVDTGSTDDTISIIEKSYKDKVKLIKHPWKNDFSEARNKSLENANGDWILILDADEKFIFDKVKLIEQLNKENVDGYNIPMYNFLGIDNILYSAVMPRLFKNDNPKYIGAIHEQITLNGEPLKSLSTFDTSVCKIIHYGYLHENVIKKKKTERNITIIKDELEKNPEDGFQWYNLGITYMGENKYGKAIDAFIESNKYSQKGRKTYHDSLVLNLAECLYREKSYKQLRNYLDALKEDNSIKRYPDYYYYYGKVFEKNKKYIKAIESYNKAIDIGEINNSISKRGIGSYISNIEIARILVKQKKVNDAVMKYIEAIFYPDNFTYKGLEELKELLIKEKMQEVLVELEKMVEEKNKKSEDKEKNKLVNEKERIKRIEDQEENKNQVKEEIQNLLEQGLIVEAKKLLNQYENIVSEDIDIYSIKGVIAIMERDIDEAERILKEGLEVNPFNFDILYNLAYLYETNEKLITAYRYYTKALKVIDGEIKESIRNKLVELEESAKVNEYINRKKVLMIAYAFPPIGGPGVQRVLKFVKNLRHFGWEPVVLTVGKTSLSIKDESLFQEVPDEVEIIRIDDVKLEEVDNKFIHRLVNMYSEIIGDTLLLNKYIKVLKNVGNNIGEYLFIPEYQSAWALRVVENIDKYIELEEIDIIYTTADPNADNFIGYLLKKYYNKPWVADFRDAWTKNPYTDYDRSGIKYEIECAMEKKVVPYADFILTATEVITEEFVSSLNLNSKYIKTITNGYDEQDFNDIDNYEIKNEKFTIIHNGLFYQTRTPLTFFKAIRNLLNKKLIDIKKLSVLFTRKDDWSKVVTQMGLDDVVEFLGYMNHKESLVKAISSDLLLLVVGSGENNKGIYTGKLFEYLRLCKPILSLSPKESLVEKLLDKTKRGKNIDFDDVEGIEEYILEAYKKWENGTLAEFSVTEDIKEYERKGLTKKLSEIFSEIVNGYTLIDNESENGYNDLNNHLKEKNSDFYNKAYESGGWNETYFKHYSETHYYEIWLKALEIIKAIDKPNIVDIGCGPGQFAKLLFDNGIEEYRGIDFSQEAIKYAKIRNDKNRNLFNIDNAYTTTLFNEKYNTVIIFEVLEHVDGDLKILSRIREGSTILFSVPNFYSDGHVRWFNSKQEIIERYKEYVEFKEILSFSVGGMNKIFLIKGKVVAKTNSIS